MLFPNLSVAATPGSHSTPGSVHCPCPHRPYGTPRGSRTEVPRTALLSRRVIVGEFAADTDVAVELAALEALDADDEVDALGGITPPQTPSAKGSLTWGKFKELRK